MNPVLHNDSTTWRARIERAIEDGVGEGHEEHDNLINLASTWSNCAVGERLEVLKAKGYPFTMTNAPRGYITDNLDDNPVNDLGMDFMYAVQVADWEDALKILDKLDALPKLEEV